MQTPVVRTVTAAEGTALARRAAAAIADRLGGRPFDGRLPAATGLRAIGATFVTLDRDGALLGCIGTLDAARPRYLDAMRNAVRAAADPRLPPVTAGQWPWVTVTVSVLSTPEPVAAESPRQLARLLRVGVDGLILTDGWRRTTFLPSVWRKIDLPDRFIAALLRKGGWVIDAGGAGLGGLTRRWPEKLTASRYTTIEFTDHAPRPAV